MTAKRRPLTAPYKWLGRFAVIYMAFTFVEGMLMLYPPAMFLLPFRSVQVRRIYRALVNMMQLTLLGFIGFMLEVVCGMRLTITGSSEILERRLERPLIISNHRTRIDWLFLICLSLRLRRLGSIKIALKEDMKHIPFVGWMLQVGLWPFLARKDRLKDLATIRNTLEYLAAIQPNTGSSFTVFPEGTDLSASNLDKSHKLQAERNLPIWNQVLLPKAGGVTEALDTLRAFNGVDALVDVTMGYTDFQPFERPDEFFLWSGRFPREVHLHLDVINWPDIPQTSEDTHTFLMERFARKEEYLKRFYAPLAFYEQSSEQVSSSDTDDQKSDFSSTQMSHLEPLLWFSEDASNEPCEETLSKDMRFVQYTMNSYVICGLISVIIHLMFWTGVWFFPILSGLYALSFLVICVVVTLVFGGFQVLELDTFSVNVEPPDNVEQSINNPGKRRPSPFDRDDSVWSKMVKLLGMRSASARRSAYIEALRRRATTSSQ